MSESNSKAERRAQARAEREAKERDDALRAQRAKRLWLLGGGLAVVAAIVVAIVALSGGSDSASNPVKAGQSPVGVVEVQTNLSGIPQQGAALGRSNAAVTLVEFADLKCPICKEYSNNVLPTLIQRYVRPGRVRMVFRAQHFVGEQQNPGDSLAAAQMTVASGFQNKLWSFAELFYRNQRDETTRYVTPAYLRFVASGVPGLNATTALAQATSPRTTKILAADGAAFGAAGFTGTPSFLIGRTGGQLAPLSVQTIETSQFTSQIDAALGKK